MDTTKFVIRRKQGAPRKGDTTVRLADRDHRRREEDRLLNRDRSEKIGAIASAGLMAELIQARKQSGLSQTEIARRMGLPQPAIVRLESGDINPTLVTVCRYAAAVGVDLRIHLRS